MKPLTDQDVKVIRFAKAVRYTTRHVYYYSKRAGAYLEVIGLRRLGPNVEVKLAEGRTFIVARDTPFFARRGR